MVYTCIKECPSLVKICCLIRHDCERTRCRWCWRGHGCMANPMYDGGTQKHILYHVMWHIRDQVTSTVTELKQPPLHVSHLSFSVCSSSSASPLLSWVKLALSIRGRPQFSGGGTTLRYCSMFKLFSHQQILWSYSTNFSYIVCI